MVAVSEVVKKVCCFQGKLTGNRQLFLNTWRKKYGIIESSSMAVHCQRKKFTVYSLQFTDYRLP